MSWTTAVGTALSWLLASNRCCGLKLSKSDAAREVMLELDASMVTIVRR